MPSRRGHDSGVETDSDGSGTMSVEFPRIYHQVDEGIADPPPSAQLPVVNLETKNVEVMKRQKMDTEACPGNWPSTSQLSKNTPASSGNKPTQRHSRAGGKMCNKLFQCRQERARLNRLYPKRTLKSDDAALREAAAANDLIKCHMLLKSGANVQGEDSRKRTPLHFAATIRNGVELVKFLLEKGADPNVHDVAGNTPLHLAICINNGPVIRELLRYGSDVTAVDRSGRNPIQLAKSAMKIILESSRRREVAECVRQETMKVIQVLQSYLEERGAPSAVMLESFQERILASKTSQEFSSDVSDLLATLQHLQL